MFVFVYILFWFVLFLTLDQKQLQNITEIKLIIRLVELTGTKYHQAKNVLNMRQTFLLLRGLN